MVCPRFTVAPAVAIVLLAPGAAFAQRPGPDTGDYLILSAQYGTERHHVDVTGRLRDEARRDRPIRAANGVFGVDPDPGRVKVLRIYARRPGGRETLFEYPEGSLVDGARFRSWSRGEWGRGEERWSGRWNVDEGEFTIQSAQYGTEHHHVDVTRRLKELARADRTFRMGNGSFGVDPDVGRIKTLRIYARGPNGRERLFEFREGSLVDGALFKGWDRGDWGNGPWHGRWAGEGRDR